MRSRNNSVSLVTQGNFPETWILERMPSDSRGKTKGINYWTEGLWTNAGSTGPKCRLSRETFFATLDKAELWGSGCLDTKDGFPEADNNLSPIFGVPAICRKKKMGDEYLGIFFFWGLKIFKEILSFERSFWPKPFRETNTTKFLRPSSSTLRTVCYPVNHWIQTKMLP